ncbi:MAG: hypothetical protein N2035_07520 [Chthoniobacterales bacterium]|nr:hypothetical protein [Chthoniobacterales bacterium]MCX7713493.1 hypothetical protein [Chthoniobacterales bacterium]
MKNEIAPYSGWEKNLRIWNDHVELFVTLDVGPRIISYRLLDRENILKNYPEQLGGMGEAEWKIRGGHRLWIAPEDLQITYHKDNSPVEYRENPDGSFSFISKQTEPIPITKELTLRLEENSSCLTLHHLAQNGGDNPIRIATWGLTVMEAGGLEILPQPPLGVHPRDLLPNRVLVLWPYTDLADPRLHLGTRFFTLRQSSEFGPMKFGISQRCCWAAYLWADCLFVKTFRFDENATYPDLGCNFETFTNEEMLEIETLSPLVELSQGQSISHSERWGLFPLKDQLELDSEDALANWIEPFINQTGFPNQETKP